MRNKTQNQTTSVKLLESAACDNSADQKIILNLVHFDMCRTIKTIVGAKHCFCLTEMVVREWRAGAGARCMAEVSTAS